MSNSEMLDAPEAVAVIGMEGRFPGARNLDIFWKNLSNGIESVSFFSAEEMAAAGLSPELCQDPNRVNAGAVLPDVDLFDAGFFGFTPREAEVMDPQLRVALECAWQAMERAGYSQASHEGAVGVFLGTSLSSYLLHNLASNPELINMVGGAQVLIRNDKDFVPTAISHKLGLRGPSLNISTACSTSLVAIQVACQSLVSFQCDMALAGGVSIHLPQGQGYQYQAQGIYAKDGHCRAFDHRGQGTVGGSGAGIVVLKRLQEALQDGDHIQAVILGGAINNDGDQKVGYTAPSVDGQAAVIEEALEMAGVTPQDISYVEAHGTGTALGDPIEMAALKQAFGDQCGRGFCAVGSVKTNVGHLDAAAGVCGLIKTILALKHRHIPASLHFEAPNPEIDFDHSPFYVNSQSTEWNHRGDRPRRAGVSAFGIGGTNAHLILEEAPEIRPSGSSRPLQLLPLTARTETALIRAGERLGHHLQDHPGIPLPDVAYTLTLGREHFQQRRYAIAKDSAEAATLLAAPQNGRGAMPFQGENPEIVFMFSGQGSQYPGMGAELYHREQCFREQVDLCSEKLRPLLGEDIRDLLFSQSQPSDEAKNRLKQTSLVQPALFTLEYALAGLWNSWGIRPQALVGHSIGEIVAACLAGVFSLDDALELVATRGRWVQTCDPGAMLAVNLGEAEAKLLLTEDLELAAVNGPDRCVISGSETQIQELNKELNHRQVSAQYLQTSHAFHSAMIASAGPALTDKVRTLALSPPRLPLLSNVTGTWMTDQEAQDPAYWAVHLRQTVRFGENLNALTERGPNILLEIGPGRTLTALAKRHGRSQDVTACLASLPGGGKPVSDYQVLLTSLGELWRRGVAVDWNGYFGAERRHRIPLPTYPFERQRYWVEEGITALTTPTASSKHTGSTVPTPAKPLRLTDLAAPLTQLEEQIETRLTIETIDRVEGLEEDLNQWCGILILEFLTKAGIPTNQGDVITRENLVRKLNLLPAFEKMLDCLLSMLREDNLIAIEGNGIRFTKDPASRPNSRALMANMEQTYSPFKGLIQFLDHCVAGFPEALSQPLAAARLLYGDGDGAFMQRKLMEETVECVNNRVYVTLMKEFILQQVKDSGRPLKILEVGGGGGILTWELAPALKGTNVQYHFTDLGKGMILAADQEANKRGLPFMSFETLDISKDPRAQGFTEGHYDFILGLDVVHATADIAQSMGHLKTLLAPGGILGLVETVKGPRWAHLIWGLAEGWWYFKDKIRSNSPLLDLSGWQTAVESVGFDEVLALPQSDHKRAHTDCGIVLATQPNQSSVAAIPQKRSTLDDYFYVPVWEPTEPPKPQEPISHWLIFADDLGLAERLASTLQQQDNQVTRVYIGPDYGPALEGNYVVDPGNPEHYDALVRDLLERGSCPTGMVHLWNLTPQEDSPGSNPLLLDELPRYQEVGIHSLLFLAQALGRHNLTHPIALSVVTNHMQAVVDGKLLNPAKATLSGAVKLIPQEYPNIRCRAIDVAFPLKDDKQETILAQRIMAETTDPDRQSFVAYRGTERFLRNYRPKPMQSPKEPLSRLRPKGVYLITGGLGGVGLALAQNLAETCSARLALLGRSTFPPREQWSQWADEHGSNDPTSQKIQILLDMERHGAELLILSADVTDPNQMSRVKSQVTEKFGAIHGIIHSAAIADEAGVIQRRSRAETDAMMASKVDGTLVLDQLFGSLPLDFFVLCSALGAIVHHLKFGEVGYVAANDFLDSFAHYKNAQGKIPTISINWTDWQDVGMSAEAMRRLEASEKKLQSEGEPLEHTLFDRRTADTDGVSFWALMSAQKHWVLADHRIDGTPTLPGVAFLEMARAAFALHTGIAQVELGDLYLLAPLTVPVDQTREVRTQLQQQEDGYTFTITSRIPGEDWQEQARGHVKASTVLQPEPLNIQALLDQCHLDKFDVDQSQFNHKETPIGLGARWNSVKKAHFGQNQGIARLELPEAFCAELNSFGLHPALLDSAVAFLSHYLLQKEGGVFLPLGYKDVRYFGPLPQKIWSFTRELERIGTGQETLRFRITIADETGKVLVEIGELTAKRIRTAPKAPQKIKTKNQAKKAAEENFALDMVTPGRLSTLGFKPIVRREPGPGEVEISLITAGLNFKEVLSALGMIPPISGLPTRFGLEGAGRVVSLGEGVTDFSVGDAVVTFGCPWTCPYITVPSRLVSSKPDHLDWEEAVSFPVAYTIAYYALVSLGGIAPKETVLIHAATGGVGLAAVHIAQQIGARVFATAGSPEKRKFLRQKGIANVMDSRSLGFASEIRESTQGRGVDIVLNSLSGDFMTQSLNLLAPHGRFLEIGQRDIHGETPVNLGAFKKGASFHSVVPDDGNPRFRAAHREVATRFAKGQFQPLPHRVFSPDQIKEAFDTMARALHIGKIVIRLDSPETYPPLGPTAPEGKTETIGSLADKATLRQQHATQPRSEAQFVKSLVQGLTNREGIEVFRRVLQQDAPQVLVSTQDLEAMLAQQQRVSDLGQQGFLEKENLFKPSHPRPDLNTAYVAPENDTQERLAAIWQELLGIDKIGIHDDFFETGGDSLIAIRVLSRLHDDFGVDQTLASLFELPTIAQLAERVETIRWADAENPNSTDLENADYDEITL